MKQEEIILMHPEEIIGSMQHLLDTYPAMLRAISEEKFSAMPPNGKWSKKEELGHMLDSAHNNLRRLVVAQYRGHPKIVYAQDFWVVIFGYRHQPASRLIALWVMLNEQFREVLKNMAPHAWERECDTGRESPELHSLQWLAADYIKHLMHHLHHILELEPLPYP